MKESRGALASGLSEQMHELMNIVRECPADFIGRISLRSNSITQIIGNSRHAEPAVSAIE